MRSRTRSSVFMHTKSPNVAIQENIIGMRYRNDAVWFFFLISDSDYASCQTARSTLVMLVANNVHKLRWPAKSLDFNTQPLQLNLSTLL